MGCRGLRHIFFDLLTSPHLLFHVPFYDKHSDSIIQKQLDIEEDAVVLVEGVFLQRPEWIEYFDAVTSLWTVLFTPENTG